jgi:hypothetical protein
MWFVQSKDSGPVKASQRNWRIKCTIFRSSRKTRGLLPHCPVTFDHFENLEESLFRGVDNASGVEENRSIGIPVVDVADNRF